MFERFRRRNDDDATRADVATQDGTSVLADGDASDEERAAAEREFDDGRTGRFDRGSATGASTAVASPPITWDETAQTVRARQYEQFGGLSLGASFFGWLVAVGMAAILAGLISAAGAALGLTEVSASDAQRNAETIGVVGGAVLLAALLIAYVCGGYVAGRLARFDGARQGLGVWIFGIVAAIALAAAAAIFGSEYNVLNRLNLPNIPVDQGTLTTAGAIALAAFVLGTLLAAVVGGKAGERYHRRVDRAGFDA
jgi:hypothetical protein